MKGNTFVECVQKHLSDRIICKCYLLNHNSPGSYGKPIVVLFQLQFECLEMFSFIIFSNHWKIKMFYVVHENRFCPLFEIEFIYLMKGPSSCQKKITQVLIFLGKRIVKEWKWKATRNHNVLCTIVYLP